MQTCPPGRRLDNQLRVDLYTSMQTNLKPLDRRQNTAAQAYAQLRAWIISGELRPGQVISEPKMAMTFGVSRTPIREVFKRLQDEQLLDIFPQQGTVVSPIDIALVRSNQFIRETLELRTIARPRRWPMCRILPVCTRKWRRKSSWFVRVTIAGFSQPTTISTKR